jgi:hypothetical protein
MVQIVSFASDVAILMDTIKNLTKGMEMEAIILYFVLLLNFKGEKYFIAKAFTLTMFFMIIHSLYNYLIGN